MKKVINWSDNTLPSEFEDKEKVGVLKTVAVYKKYQGYGIGKMLTEECIRELSESGIDSMCSIAWKNEDKTNIGGVLSILGFKVYEETKNYWTEDSLKNGYSCPTCGEPPCQCTGVIYIK